jgi:RNA polymerase sigma-70 factor (ECF subfamily)
MPTPERLAEQFEEHRAHLRAVAYRMLASASEAEDAVQESWIRLGRTDVNDVENLRAWLTTVVARVCLDMLRTRTSRREDPLDTHVPDPVITRADGDPESDTMLADSVGLALLVVLETLEPAERLAFVLHDVFGMTFDEIAPIVDRRVVDAFMAAAREGDFERLVAVLDPDIVLRADGGALTGASRVVRGASTVAAQAATFSRLGLSNQLVLVNGHLGFVSRRPDGRLFAVLGFTITGGKVVEIDILADPERLSRLDLSAIEG